MTTLLNKATKSNILVVDDSAENLRILSSMLTEEGFAVRCARSGLMALTTLQNTRADLILLDIKMPQMSGYEVCEHLKADPVTREIPVIFISALDEAMDKVKAFDLGGVDYITKPFELPEVLARIENQITISRLRMQLQNQQRKLLKQNQALMRSNRELEQFAHVMSHDLKQPLQSFLFAIGLVEQCCKGNPNSKVFEYLKRLRDISSSMQKVIEALLDYARVGNEELVIEEISCDAILAMILDNLQVAMAEQSAVIHHDSLPTVMADRNQLMQLFHHLITNALKFQPQGNKPEISISVSLLPQDVIERSVDIGFLSFDQDEQSPIPGSQTYLFGVHDNGIGIDADKVHLIFEVFQRINADDYAGTGMGLATCKKILERHNGRIWVESEPDKGTSVYFTFPQQQQE
ncbi:response regulator [Acaryochloris sp. IP29b_bin.148]|uniref:sensor histidine kinase n=1 Tax=Acaryochloris sp. IP29b_bin.148 TaxID=2969218 RepID=UPI002623EC8D|nr:response regulator [Acaryochloris sp. IP29b_bin.148]